MVRVDLVEKVTDMKELKELAAGASGGKNSPAESRARRTFQGDYVPGMF